MRLESTSLLREMLSHYLIQRTDQKQAIYQKLFGEDRVFVVSDLPNKLWLQKLYLQVTGKEIMSGQRFFRASELWQTCLQRCDWRWRSIPRELVIALLEQEMSLSASFSQSWSIQEAPRLAQVVGQLLPILSHPQGDEILGEWLNSNEEARRRWGHWYDQAKLGWSFLLKNRILPQDWMKAVLLSEDLRGVLDQALLFDLDLDCDEIEAELIINLARRLNVQVLIPARFSEHPAYQALIKLSQEIKLDDKTEGGRPAPQILKLPSRLSEVKQATAQIRQWLDSGLQPQEIALVSTQIEEYWPNLRDYLQIEGVPVEKGLATPLSQIPALQKWLALVAWRLGMANRDELELVLYNQANRVPIPFSLFRSRYQNLYGSEDLQRLPLPDHLQVKMEDPKRSFNLADFLHWSLETTLLNASDKSQVIELMDSLDEILSFPRPLSAEQWLRFFKRFLVHRERSLSDPQDAGIALLHPGQASARAFKAVFVLGLSEAALREVGDTPLLYRDVESLRFQFGINLSHQEDQKLSATLQWWLTKASTSTVLSYAEADFGGQFQAPSLFWLQKAIELGHSLEMDTPLMTRQDELMRSQQRKFQEQSEESPVFLGLRRDQGKLEPLPVKIQSLSLSASKLEELSKCPFRFLAQAGFQLKSESVFDMDLDSMNRGKLLHRICEVLIGRKSLALTETQLGDLIDDCAQDLKIEFYSNEIWSFSKPYYVRFAKEFSQFEIKWRQLHPLTQTLGTEVKVAGHLQRQGDRAVFSSDGWPFRGVIDRIDRSPEGDLVLLDYKSSGNSLFQHSSWYSKSLLQLVIYALAIEDQALALQGRVVGLYYYVLSDLDRSRGLHFNLDEEGFLPKSKIGADKFTEWLEEGRSVLSELLQRIESGHLGPHPKDLKTCEKCDKRQMCRHWELD